MSIGSNGSAPATILPEIGTATAVPAEQEVMIRVWLAQIDETDEVVIVEVLNHCQQDEGARDYFIRLASVGLRPDLFPGDRRRCDQCANLTGRGLCLAAWRDEIAANSDYEPVSDLPRRCEGYLPGADDPDRRPGGERWPELIQKGEE